MLLADSQASLQSRATSPRNRLNAANAVKEAGKTPRNQTEIYRAYTLIRGDDRLHLGRYRLAVCLGERDPQFRSTPIFIVQTGTICRKMMLAGNTCNNRFDVTKSISIQRRPCSACYITRSKTETERLAPAAYSIMSWTETNLPPGGMVVSGLPASCSTGSTNTGNLQATPSVDAIHQLARPRLSASSK